MSLLDLAKPFPEGDIHWRVQGTPYERNGQYSALALAYLDARDVMDRLDEACGPENWQSEFAETAKGRVVCRLGIRIGDDWVWKSDGAGDTDVEGEKGGLSDALKRAAVAWGIGRYLYRLDPPWVRCEVNQRNGKTYWKKWLEDPWSKVKSNPSQPKEARKATSAEKRDWFKGKVAAFKDLGQLNAWWEGDKVKAALKTLDEPHRLEIENDFSIAVGFLAQAPGDAA